MGRKEKLIQRLLSVPKDFTFEEMQSLLENSSFKITPQLVNAAALVGNQTANPYDLSEQYVIGFGVFDRFIKSFSFPTGECATKK